MEKLAENDLTYFYLRHVVIVVTAVSTFSLPPVIMSSDGVVYLRNKSWKPECALTSMNYFDSDMSKSTNTVVYFDWKTVIYIYACGQCRT